MAAKAGPIVITLKKRLNNPREDEDEGRSSGGRAGAAPPSASTPAPACSRSRSRSPLPNALPRGISPAALSPARAPTAAPSSNVLNVGALEDIFARFHGELDAWLQAESEKLERAEARGSTDKETLKGAAEGVCDYLREYAPRTYADLGSDPSGEGFTTRTLPQFLELMEEDRRAILDMTTTLTTFAERRFPKGEDLAELKSSPTALLRSILRQLTAANGGGSAADAGGGKGGDEGASAGGARERRRRRRGQ